MAIGEKIFTRTLSDGAITITSADGLTRVSVLCTSSTAGTITGTGVVGGTSSSAMNIAENTSVTIGTDSGYPISSLVITAPSGCTLEITGSIG
tara:strand:+ start:393 stop:671 length:279 start_codon:yes stop_codon:yes gene_type:complete